MATTQPHRLTVPEAGISFLLAELAELSRSRSRDHQRRLGRIAITFRPCKQGRDAIPDQPIPIDAFKLLSITYGWSEGRRGHRPKVTLGIYRATFDTTAKVPIRFQPEQVHDLVRPRSLTGSHYNATAIRSGVVLHQAVEDGDPAEFATGLEWPRFFFAFEPGWPPEFAAGDQAEAQARERIIEGLRAWPADLFIRSGGEQLRVHPPKQVFASLAHLKGREVRNPAFGVLKSHGLLPRPQDYRSWLGTVSELKNGVRVIRDPGSDRTEAGRLRRLIESHVLADRAREGVMLGDLESACVAMGVKLPEGPARVDRLAELLDNPWAPAAVPYAAGVQRLRPAGPASGTLTDGVSILELEEDTTFSRRNPVQVARLSPDRLSRS